MHGSRQTLYTARRTWYAGIINLNCRKGNTLAARSLMIQGTSSNVGKSLLVTALCRIYTRRGYDVSPFKSQNMALNSFATPDGLEIGRAQAMQAIAAGKEASVLFNPILLKPESDGSSQVVLMGKPWKSLKGGEYYKAKPELWHEVTATLERLKRESELILVEGAGSPAEINLKKDEIVNMRVADYLQSPVLLTADIDRGGVFAFLYGTLQLLEPHERDLVKGFLINKFRGNIDLLTPGIRMLDELTGHIPTVGVLPYIKDLQLAQEDSVFLDEQSTFGDGSFDIAVIRLPHISNYDDFDALTLEENIRIRFVQSVHELGNPKAIILPGSKTTIEDLIWLKSTGLAREVISAANRGVAVAGICGGYQMLGKVIHDDEGIEGISGDVTGLGLLDAETEMLPIKTTIQTTAVLEAENPFAPTGPVEASGYQIHMGTTRLHGKTQPLFRIAGSADTDGAYAESLPVWGTYLHGVFDTPSFRRSWLRSIGWDSGMRPVSLAEKREEELERLADIIEEHLDMKLLDSIIGVS